MNRNKRFTAILAIVILLLSLCSGITVADGTLVLPEEAPDFASYGGAEGVAWDSGVAGLAAGDAYTAYWEGAPYTFTVGVDVFATFEEAYAASTAGIPTVFALPGQHGSITLTGPVRLYGYFYQLDPNVRDADETVCPRLTPAREKEMESCFDNITVAANVRGTVEIRGIVLQGIFNDSLRPVSGTPTEITLENIIIRQQSGVADGSFAINLLNQNAQEATTACRVNQDGFTLRNCRIESIVTKRIFSNAIPTRFTVDGLVTVDGTTTYFGYAQWRRYRENAAFTLKNCYFDHFVSTEGLKFFLYMEGLNKFNGDCTISITDNVFTGDANYMLGLYVKKGYNITISGNTFIAASSSGREPFYWNISYDTNLYSDYAANADVSSVNLSDRVTISKNRFIGYTSFKNKVNDYTVFDLSDNFFTNELTGYKTAVGSYPTVGTGAAAASIWLDYDFSTFSTDIPALTFGGSFSADGSSYVLYTDQAKVDLRACGLSYPVGARVTLSTGEAPTAVACAEGVNTLRITVYSYDGTASKAYTLQIIRKSAQSAAIARLAAAQIRLESGCYTDSSLKSYRTCVSTLRSAIRQGADTAAALTALDAAEAALVYKSGAQADFRYYSYFSDLKRFYIADTAGWKNLAAEVHGNNGLYGVTISLTADLDFGGETIRPVGGCYDTDTATDDRTFFGTLEGNNHLISNFVINEPEGYGVGLFGRTACAVVRNLRLGKGSITGYDKVGGIAGFADGTALHNCSNEADVIAVDGVSGIGGIASQARRVKSPYKNVAYSADIVRCINYGSVTNPSGRACGISAWGQTTCVQKYCVSYGQLNGASNKPFGDYGTADLSKLVVDCYYTQEESNAGTRLTEGDLKAAAYICGLALSEDRLVLPGCGEKVYRAQLQWEKGTSMFYGTAGEQIAFDIPGYSVQTVTLKGQTRPLVGLCITSDCVLTGEPIPYDYTIQYVTNGGAFTSEPVRSYRVEEAVTLPFGSALQKNGYLFGGWYTTADFSGERITDIPAGTTKDYTLYARFVSIDQRISTAAQLVALANAVNSGKSMAGKGILITADIDLGGIAFPGIGNSMLHPFGGVLAGGCHTVSGLSVSGVPVAGLVGVLSSTGVVTEVAVKGSVSGNVAGGIVGNNLGGLVEACSFNGSVSSSATEIRVISQNVRINSNADLHGAADRHTPLRDILKRQNPDVIGFQEADTAWQGYLKNDFSEYDSVWVWRGLGSNNTTQGKEATPIFYKRDKFNLLDSGVFWLSDTPNQPSYCFTEDLNRTVAWVKLQVKKTGEVFYCFNTHYPLNEESRIKSAEVLREKVFSMAGDDIPFFITADYNMSPNSKPYLSMQEWSSDMALKVEVDATNNSGTFNAFNVTSFMRADMCFANAELCTSPYYKVILDTYFDSEGRECPPSDHYGVFFRFCLQSASGGITGNNQGKVLGCMAVNNGTAAVYGGTLAGVNRGEVYSYCPGGSSFGVNYGVDRSYKASSLREGVVLLNRQLGRRMWGMKDGAIVFLPNADRIYKAAFLNLNGAVAQTGFYTESEINAYQPGYETEVAVFDHWDWQIVGETVTLTPVMRVVKCRVTFLDRQGNLVSEQLVGGGNAVTPPVLADDKDWVFIGWDRDLSVITEDQTVQSLWAERNQFTLTVRIEGSGTLRMNGSPVESGGSFTAAGGTAYRLTAETGTLLYWKDESGAVLADSASFAFALTKNTVLTAVFSVPGEANVIPAPPTQPAETPATDAMITLTDELCLIRNVQGDYTVLGSGILYADDAASVLLLESADGETVFTAAAVALTRKGSASFDVSAQYVRGYLVLLDERTGKTVVLYTDIVKR